MRTLAGILFLAGVACAQPRVIRLQEDLQLVRKAIGAARIVAVGDAEAGREFTPLKHHLLEFLAGEMGFSVLAVDANWPESLAVNAYVLRGEGDPAAALQSLGTPRWNTPAALELLEWMRRFNLDPAHARKLEFAGIDVRSAHAAAGHVLTYLREVEPPAAAEYARTLEELTTPEKEARLYWPLPGHEKRLIAGMAEEFVQRFERNRAPYVARSSQAEWALARRYADFVRQAASLQDAGNRERFMAENAQWILDQHSPGAKMIIWAPEETVQTSDAPYAVPSMGAHLRRIYGDSMVALEIPAPSTQPPN